MNPTCTTGAAYGAHSKMLLFNLIMFACDVAKYVGNRKENDAKEAKPKSK